MPANNETIIPPGEHPNDSRIPNIDQVGFALKRLQTFLIWIGEHRSSYEKHRNVDSVNAENEMSCLKDAIEQAIVHLQRLTELILAGYGIDSTKVLPKDICSVVWSRAVESIAKRRLGKEKVE
jgi:hypothetical protein